MRPKYRVDLRLDKKTSFGGKSNKAELIAKKKAFEDEHNRRIEEWKRKGEEDAVKEIARQKKIAEENARWQAEEMRKVRIQQAQQPVYSGWSGIPEGPRGYSGIAGLTGFSGIAGYANDKSALQLSQERWEIAEANRLRLEDAKKKELDELYKKWVQDAKVG